MGNTVSMSVTFASENTCDNTNCSVMYISLNELNKINRINCIKDWKKILS